MIYYVPLRDSVIFTDDYSSNEEDLLVSNLMKDLRSLRINYPVPVFDSNHNICRLLLPPF